MAAATFHGLREVSPNLPKFGGNPNKTVWYVRVDKGRRIRIGAAFGTPDFDAAYQAAITDLAVQKEKNQGASAGTLAWLIERYRETGAWTNLSLATRRQRENIFRPALERIVNKRLALFRRRF